MKLNELLNNLRNLELPSTELHQCLLEKISSDLNNKISELYKSFSEAKSDTELARIENETRKLANFLYTLEGEINILKQLDDVQKKLFIHDIHDYLIKGLELKEYFKVQTIFSNLSKCYLELLHQEANKRCEDVQRSLNSVLTSNELDPQLREAWLTLLEPEIRIIEEIKGRLISRELLTSTLEIVKIRTNAQEISETLHLLDELESRIEDYQKIKQELLTPRAVDIIIKGLISGGVSSDEDVVKVLNEKLYEDIYSLLYRNTKLEASQAAQLAEKFIKTFASSLWRQVTLQRMNR
jgi:hypothetical protein